MKTFFDAIKLTFVILGGIIGGGFVSGKELSVFFGGISGTETIIVLSVCYLLSFAAILLPERERAKTEKQKKLADVFSIGLLLSAFISFSLMVSAYENVLKEYLGAYSIFLLVPCMGMAARLAVKGTAAAEKTNVILTGAVVTAIVAFSFDGISAPLNGKTTIIGGINGLLYVFMNAFVNCFAIRRAKKGKNKKSAAIAVILSTIILVFLTILVLKKITKAETMDKELPLLSSVNEKFKIAFSVIMLAAIFTSAVSAYSPIADKAKEKSGGGFIVNAVIIAAAFLFARAGMESVIKYGYPVIGVIGGAFITTEWINFIRLRKNTNKRLTKFSRIDILTMLKKAPCGKGR